MWLEAPPAKPAPPGRPDARGAQEGEPIPLGGPKQRALLAMLLLEAGRVVSQDSLVEALWEGSPPATAVASLQNFVAQLRKRSART